MKKSLKAFLSGLLAVIMLVTAIPFAVFAETRNEKPSLDTKSVLLGDADQDGYVSIGDAIIVLRVTLGLQPATVPCDINADGHVAIDDAILTLRVTLQLCQPFYLIEELTEFEAIDYCFPIQTAMECTFVVTADGNVGRIDLCDANGIVIGIMHDDGVNGDEVSNDGVYSYTCSVREDNPCSKSYYARCGQTLSDRFEIYFIPELTQELVAIANEVIAEIQAVESLFLDADGFVPQQSIDAVIAAVSEYTETVVSNGDLLFSNTNEDSVFIKFASGLPYVYTPKTTNSDSNGNDTQLTVFTYQPCLDTYSDDLDDWMNLPDSAAQSVADVFSHITFNNATNLDNEQVTLNRVKSLGSNKVIIWHGHGGYDKKLHSFILTGEAFDWNAWWWDPVYWWDCVCDRIVNTSSGTACFTSKFIKEYCGDLHNDLIYMAACSSGRDDVLANSFLGKGAKAYVGNSNTIYTVYNLVMQNAVITKMTEVNPSTSNYYTLSEALNAAKQVYGENDVDFAHEFTNWTNIKPSSQAASPKIFGGSNAQNYRFKNGGIDGVEFDGHKYKLFDSISVSSWREAEEYCESLGGHLATLTSQEENDFVYSYIKSLGVYSAYFGLSDDIEEGNWLWVNGETSAYRNWANGEPNSENTNEDYAMFYYKFTDGKWNDGSFGYSVNDVQAFICEWDYITPTPGDETCLAELECIDEGHYTGNVGDSRVYRLDKEPFIGYEPYGCDGTYRNGNTLADTGVAVNNGFEIWIARWNFTSEISFAYRTFRLDRPYSRLTGRTGLIESHNTTNFDSTLYFYDSNGLIAEYRLTPDNYDILIDIDLTGVDELKAMIQDNVAVAGGTSFAVYDLFLR